MKRRVLIVYSTFNVDRPIGDPSVWYRCYNFAERLKLSNIVCDIIDDRQIERVEDYLSYYEKIVFFRPRQSKELLKCIVKARRLSIECIASYDDLIFDPSTYSLSSTIKSFARKDLVHARYKDWANAFEIFDSFIVSSENLKQNVLRLKRSSNCIVIDNWLPTSIIDFCAAKRTKKDNNLLGYFGGGLSHLNDVLSIEKALLVVCKSEGFKVTMPESIAGKVSHEFQAYIEPFGRLDYIRMLELCCKTNICLAPVLLDSNSSAKSSIKFTEALVCGGKLAATYIDAYEPYNELQSIVAVEGYSDSWAESITALSKVQVSSEETEFGLKILNDRVDNGINQLIG